MRVTRLDGTTQEATAEEAARLLSGDALTWRRIDRLRAIALAAHHLVIARAADLPLDWDTLVEALAEAGYMDDATTTAERGGRG